MAPSWGVRRFLCSCAGYPAAEVSFAAGYTGLILNQSSQIALSKGDNYDTAAGETLASPRAIAVLTMQFPELLLRQDVTLSLLAQEDLRPAFEANADAAAVTAKSTLDSGPWGNFYETFRPFVQKHPTGPVY